MNRQFVNVIAVLAVFGVIACGPNSKMHPKRAKPADQQKSRTFTVDEDPDSTLLPDSIKTQIPRLPEQSPDLETPVEDSTPPAPAKETNPPEEESPSQPPVTPPAQPPAPPETNPTPIPSPVPSEPPPTPAPSQRPTTPSEPTPTPAPAEPDPTPAPVPKSPEPTPEPVPEPKVPRGRLQIPPTQHDAAIAHATVRCEGSGPRMCPNEVGMLVVKTNNSLTQCTAFLVGDQYLMTNSHCIPPSLKADGANCRGRIQVFFPKTDSQPAERVSCERMIRSSKISGGEFGNFGSENDYALMQLSHPTARGSLTVNRDGLDDEMKLAFYSVSPQSTSSATGLLKASVCVAKQRALTSPSFVRPQAPVGTVSGCAFVPGNSGSPGIDSKRQVRAVLHAIVGQPVTSQEEGTNKRNFNPLALVSILGCTDLPPDAGPLAAQPHSDCAKKLSVNDMIRQIVANADTRGIEKMGREWRQSAPRELGFEFRRNGNEESAKPLFSPVITCIQDPSRWTSSKSSDGTLTLKFTLPLWGYHWDVDADDRLILIPEISIQQNATLRIQANRSATLTVKDAATGSSYTVNNRYPVCQ